MCRGKAWSLHKGEEETLERTEMRMMRVSVGISLRDAEE